MGSSTLRALLISAWTRSSPQHVLEQDLNATAAPPQKKDANGDSKIFLQITRTTHNYSVRVKNMLIHSKRGCCWEGPSSFYCRGQPLPSVSCLSHPALIPPSQPLPWAAVSLSLCHITHQHVYLLLYFFFPPVIPKQAFIANFKTKAFDNQGLFRYKPTPGKHSCHVI